MDPLQIKAATDQIIKALPGLEGFLDDQRNKLAQTVNLVLTEALAGFSEGLEAALQLGYSIDGITVDFEVEPIVVPAIKAQMKINMPLKGKGN